MWWIIGIAAAIILIGIGGTKQAKWRERKIAETREQLNQQLRRNGGTISANFEWSDPVMHERYFRVVADHRAEKLYICRGTGCSIDTLPYETLTGIEVLIDSKVVGAVKRGVVGGLLAGTPGLILGAITANKKQIRSFRIVFYRNDALHPTYELSLFRAPVKAESADFRTAQVFAQNLHAAVKGILARERRRTVSAEGQIVAQPRTAAGNAEKDVSLDESVERLKKLKEAFDAGAITQADYEERKAEILRGI